LVDFRNLDLGQVDASEIGREVNARSVAIAAEGSLERLSRKMRSRTQEVLRLRVVANFAAEGGVV
jgi:hypothetical protein